MAEILSVEHQIEIVERDFVELVETELALVGGGTGDISLG